MKTLQLPIVGEAPRDARRPRTRGDCVDGARPCPFADCRYHLGSSLSKSRQHALASGAEVLAETCVLDVADRRGVSLAEIGHLLGYTRERAWQIEAKALKKAKTRLPPDLADRMPWAAPEEAPLADEVEGVFSVEFYEAVRRAHDRIVPPELRGAGADGFSFSRRRFPPSPTAAAPKEEP